MSAISSLFLKLIIGSAELISSAYLCVLFIRSFFVSFFKELIEFNTLESIPSSLLLNKYSTSLYVNLL